MTPAANTALETLLRKGSGRRPSLSTRPSASRAHRLLPPPPLAYSRQQSRPRCAGRVSRGYASQPELESKPAAAEAVETVRRQPAANSRSGLCGEARPAGPPLRARPIPREGLVTFLVLLPHAEAGRSMTPPPPPAMARDRVIRRPCLNWRWGSRAPGLRLYDSRKPSSLQTGPHPAGSHFLAGGVRPGQRLHASLLAAFALILSLA